MSQPLVKTPLMRYNRLRWVMRAISCEQLEEMDLLTIGFQLPPIAIYTFLEKSPSLVEGARLEIA